MTEYEVWNSMEPLIWGGVYAGKPWHDGGEWLRGFKPYGVPGMGHLTRKCLGWTSRSSSVIWGSSNYKIHQDTIRVLTPFHFMTGEMDQKHPLNRWFIDLVANNVWWISSQKGGPTIGGPQVIIQVMKVTLKREIHREGMHFQKHPEEVARSVGW